MVPPELDVVRVTTPVTHRLYAVVRDDAGMGAGKCASQAGHAFLDAFLLSQQSAPYRCDAYRAHRHGTKVVLTAGYEHLRHLLRKAKLLGLPVVPVIDEGCPNFFGGEPVLTAIGLGPLTRQEASRLLGGLPLLT
jgi:peptidyl-tRNA hydrolase